MKFIFSALLASIFLLTGISDLSAQVTVGSGQTPEKHAILQIKEKDAATPGGATVTTGGFLLPRVELVKRYELLPFVDASLVGVNDPDYENYQKPAHTGLMVFNLKEVSGEDLFVGINQWDGEKWNGLQDRMGNAAGFLGKCDSLTFQGEYQNKVALNSSNYMTIPLHITKPGAYTLTATANPENGYYFTTSGVFLSKGYYYLTVPGAGSPINFSASGSNGDRITIALNGVTLATCDPKYIFVEDSSVKPKYEMSCADTNVRGVYKLNQPLNSATNFIEMTLNVDASALGATYIIETNTVDGIYFKGRGILDRTTQTVRLEGYGTPTTTTPKQMTIKSNSITSVATCSATVIVVLPKKKIFVLGNNTTYGYDISITGTGSNKVFTSTNNFGTLETSYVKTESATFLYPASNITGAMSASDINRLNTAINTDKVDIIVVTQDVYLTAPVANTLANFLLKGGVLLCFYEGNGYTGAPNLVGGSTTSLMSAIFGNPEIDSRQINALPGAVYKLSTTNDVILNGPFGDVRGQQWGEDASWARGVSNLPLGDIDVYSTGYDMTVTSQPANSLNVVSAFKHKTLNLVYFGDGGFVSSAGGNPTAGATLCPFYWNTSTMFPTAKTGYGKNTSNQTVYNSIIFCNVMAWALQQAEFNGINTVKK